MRTCIGFQIDYRLRVVEAYIIEKVQKFNYDGTRDGWDDSWTFSNSLLLTISIMTTIGIFLEILDYWIKIKIEIQYPI